MHRNQITQILDDDDLYGRSTIPRSKVSSSLEERHYATTDANHNVTSIDDVFGAVKERFVYDPYRNSTVLTSAFATTSDAYGFIVRSQGQREDATTNTIDSRNRVYGLGIGRWMQADNIGGYVDGANLYQFARSMPIALLDPIGLAVEPSWGQGSAGLPDPTALIGVKYDPEPELKNLWNTTIYYEFSPKYIGYMSKQHVDTEMKYYNPNHKLAITVRHSTDEWSNVGQDAQNKVSSNDEIDFSDAVFNDVPKLKANGFPDVCEIEITSHFANSWYPSLNVVLKNGNSTETVAADVTNHAGGQQINVTDFKLGGSNDWQPPAINNKSVNGSLYDQIVPVGVALITIAHEEYLHGSIQGNMVKPDKGHIKWTIPPGNKIQAASLDRSKGE